MAQQTRHGLYGGPRPVYASFAGKVETVIVATTILLTEPATFRSKAAPATFRPSTDPATFRPKTAPVGGPD